jgi:DNA-binding MarR family transcriptional regulator
MPELYGILFRVQQDKKIRCIHNEFHIVMYLYENGPASASQLEKITLRSPAGHRNDVSRLVGKEVLEVKPSIRDRRLRMYDLTDKIRRYISDVIKN